MNELKFSSNYENYEVYFEFQEYVSNGATVVLALFSGGLSYTKVSINIEHAPTLPKGQFYFKDWSENVAIAKAMINDKLIEPVEGTMPTYSGFIVAHAYQFTEDGLNYVENAKEFLQHRERDFLQKSIIESEVFLDEKKTMSFVDTFFNLVFPNESDKIQRYWAERHIKANFHAIHQYAESPIEKIFLCSLNMNFSIYDIFHIAFTPPLDNAEEFPEYFRERHADIMNFLKAYQMATGIDDVDVFSDRIDDDGILTYEQKEIIKAHVLFYDRLGMYNRYQLSLQPRFQTIKVDGKLIRPDLLIWIPSKPNFKLVVECDGYAYHSDKIAFSRDRARDRILQSKGYQVFRFSGHEIYHDPVGKSNELFDYLIELEKNVN